MLVQDHVSLRCVIGFAGINNYGNELATATDVRPAAFCGFQDVHAGYREELRKMMKHLFPKLREVMGKCRRPFYYDKL